MFIHFWGGGSLPSTRNIQNNKIMKNTTYYGFSSASSSEEPAWFYTAEAALRFANECGWRTGEDQQPLTIDDVETTDDPNPDDIMDEPLELNFAGWFLRAVEGPEINPADLERLVAAARESVAKS